MLTIEKNKELIERYPFLLPRNVFTDKVDEDYDFSYIRGIGEIPAGWNKLFLQMCEDLRKQLVKDGELDSFRFTQIKEKYNRMELYNCGCSTKAYRILDKYTNMSQYVCTVCGKPATKETHGYVASFCDKCYDNHFKDMRSDAIEFQPYYQIITYKNCKKVYYKYSFKREWNRYIKAI